MQQSQKKLSSQQLGKGWGAGGWWRERRAGFTVFRKYPRGGGEQGGGLQPVRRPQVHPLTAGERVTSSDWEDITVQSRRALGHVEVAGDTEAQRAGAACW